MADVARTIAIGDIHGCLAAFDALLAAIVPDASDTLITLGDYVDRGPDSRGVIDRLLELRRRCRLIPILGNHDALMLDVYDGRSDLYVEWLMFGGNATLASYDTLLAADMPDEHVNFLRNCLLYYETERFFFIHGTYLAHMPVDSQPKDTLLWESIKTCRPGPHYSGKTAIVGHSSQKSGEILDLGYLKCIDTWCYGDGWLTALDVDTGRVWQANKHGKIRG